MDTDVLIILVLSILSFTLTSLLLFTIYSHRSRIPRHSVITTLLWTTLPRIIFLLLPFLMREQLQVGVPFHMKDRNPGQQRTTLAKWCAAQGLLVNYFLTANATFICSFTLLLLHIVLRPYPLTSAHSKSYTIWSLSLSLLPLIYALPIPLLGLGLILTTPTSKAQIIYFQGTYCNIDVYAFQFTCGMLAGMPLIISLGMLTAAGMRVWKVRMAVDKSRQKRVKRAGTGVKAEQERGMFNWEDKEAISNSNIDHPNGSEDTHQPHLNVNLTVTSAPTSTSTPTSPISPSLSSPDTSTSTSTLHIRLASRMILLALEITISALLFLLQISLSDAPLTRALVVDKYWEAIAPLLQFAIFASQSAVLEVWFPMWFGNRSNNHNNGSPDAFPKDSQGNVLVSVPHGVTGIEGKFRPSLGGHQTQTRGQRGYSPTLSPSLDSLGLEGHASEVTLDSFGDMDVDIGSEFGEVMEGGSEGSEAGSFHEGGQLATHREEDQERTGGLDANDLEWMPVAGPSRVRSNNGVFTSVFDSDVGHLPLQQVAEDVSWLEDKEDIRPDGEGNDGEETANNELGEEQDSRRPKHAIEPPSRSPPSSPPRQLPLTSTSLPSSPGRGTHTRTRSAKSSTDRNTKDGEGDQNERSVTRQRKSSRRPRFDPAIPTFLKKGPGRLPER